MYIHIYIFMCVRARVCVCKKCLDDEYLKISRDLLFRPSRTEVSFLLFHVVWFVSHYSFVSSSPSNDRLRRKCGNSPYWIPVDGPIALPGYSLRGRGVKTTPRLFTDIEATVPFPPFGIRRNPQRRDLRFTPLQGLAKLRRRSLDIGYASFSRNDAACSMKSSYLARENTFA